jgi:hypothetical protein
MPERTGEPGTAVASRSRPRIRCTRTPSRSRYRLAVGPAEGRYTAGRWAVPHVHAGFFHGAWVETASPADTGGGGIQLDSYDARSSPWLQHWPSSSTRIQRAQAPRGEHRTNCGSEGLTAKYASTCRFENLGGATVVMPWNCAAVSLSHRACCAPNSTTNAPTGALHARMSAQR